MRIAKKIMICLSWGKLTCIDVDNPWFQVVNSLHMVGLGNLEGQSRPGCSLERESRKSPCVYRYARAAVHGLQAARNHTLIQDSWYLELTMHLMLHWMHSVHSSWFMNPSSAWVLVLIDAGVNEHASRTAVLKQIGDQNRQNLHAMNCSDLFRDPNFHGAGVPLKMETAP